MNLKIEGDTIARNVGDLPAADRNKQKRYQDTSLTKVGESWMPALASKMDDRLSDRKSVETTSSSV
jgi:hypothetical protein